MSTLFGGNEAPAGDVAALPQNPDQIMAGFKKMAEAAALTLQGENSASDDEVAKYSDSIAQALKGLQEGTDNLAAPVSENDITSMFGNLNLENVKILFFFFLNPTKYISILGRCRRRQHVFAFHGRHDAKSAVC